MNIKMVSNGYILDDGESIIVFKNSKEDILELLYSILDSIQSSSRHDEKRIQIRIVHGDKYECKNKRCPICKENK